MVALVALVACKSKPHDSGPEPSGSDQGSSQVAPTPPPPMDRAALLDGKLPEGAPMTDLINAQCRICHAAEYLTQQRLSEAGWTKTIAKMKKFGANVSDADAAVLAKFAANYWNPDLPPRTAWKLVTPPAGAVP
jgi:hypothetical protein